MTTVLIVDDEVVFRNSLKEIINWEMYGFYLCGEASDGISAKQKIEKLEPDIVITDIKMSGMDGLSLIAYLHENYPHIQVIALSGYDDYEYVRTSLKQGVVDYLLKHNITASSLLNVLQTAQKQINRAKESKLDAERMKKQIAIGYKMLRQRFLADLLEGRAGDLNEITRQAKELSLPIGTAGSFLVVAAEFDNISTLKSRNTKGEWQVLFERMMELIGENLSSDAMLIPQFDVGFAILFSSGETHSQNSFLMNVNACINQIRIALKRHYNITACYSISGISSSPLGIAGIYKNTRAALGERIYRGTDTVIHDRTIPKSVYRNYCIDFNDEHNIIRLIQNGCMQEVREYIAKIFSNIRESGLNSVQAQLIFAHLVNLLTRTLREYKTDLMTIYPDFYYIYQNLQQMSLDEMQKEILECYINAMKYIRKFGETEKYREITRQAILYINRNYTRDISLNTIAEHLHTSPSYLSRIFKEDTGCGVTEYLNRIRMEHAKQLIRDGIRLNEIYMRSGFNSDTYFYMVFKNITGKTPKKFREECFCDI